MQDANYIGKGGKGNSAKWQQEAMLCGSVISALSAFIASRDLEDMSVTFYERDGLAYILNHISYRLTSAVDGDFLSMHDGAMATE